MSDLLKLPIGEEFFTSIRRKGFYYVDKTQMIADFMRNRGSVNLFTRPRRFGKSLNMDMFKSFLETGADPGLFEGLSIMRDTAVCDAHLGKYPVISVSFKDVDGSTFEKALDSMSSILTEEARRHAYLLESEKLSAIDKSYLQPLYSLELKESTQRSALRLLSEMLAKHHGTNVVLLIDEYDVPLDKSWQKHYYTDMVEHIRLMFSKALKTNPFLEFAIITGCLRVARESIFTGINNFEVNSISDTLFADSFGFTDEEVRGILAYYQMPEQFSILKEWYDGYCFGGHEIYCPWDVIKQVKKFLVSPKAPMEPHWINSSSNYIVRDLMNNPSKSTQADIEMLISGEAITKAIAPELTYADLDTEDEELRQTWLWSVLYATGYLTDQRRTDTTDYGTGKPDSRNNAEEMNFSANGRMHRLVIPNREIREIFETQILSWFKRKVRKQTKEWSAFCDALFAGDAEKVEKCLNGFLEESISIRDTAARKERKENFYHGILLGLLKADGRLIIQSNAESGIGYLDIKVIDPFRKIGCAIEVKYAENGNYDTACAEAMQQIEDNDYAAVLRKEDITVIHKYGISFYKKSCRVRHEQ